MITFKEFLEEGAQEDFAKIISQHPKEKRAAFKRHYNKMRAKGMMPVTALQYTHNLMKEEEELEEFAQIMPGVHPSDLLNGRDIARNGGLDNYLKFLKHIRDKKGVEYSKKLHKSIHSSILSTSVTEGIDLEEVFSNRDSGSTGTSKEDKRIAAKRAEWNKQQAEKRARAAARMAELDAMPDPTPEENAKNQKTLASIIGWQKKHGKEVSGS